MPELFLELFSEEIPARMQREAASQLEKLCTTALEALQIAKIQIFYGPRRIALKAEITSEIPARNLSERGPRATAPEQALAGFLRKHDATRDQLVQEGDFWVLYKTLPAASAAQAILENLPKSLAQFPWPKSMRWGQSGDFNWIRPLRRITCLLDGEIIPITLGPITASNITEGHRIHGPGPFTVSSAAIWEESLREHHVIADQDERRRIIADGIAAKAAELNLTVAPDDALLDEVTGLVEYPVPLIGKIDANFMDLPPEVRELSMKINQKYFALRDAGGTPAPYFAFVANLAAHDSGAAITAGNERVLRARLSDARHFWKMDRRKPLKDFLPQLSAITFHHKIGNQLKRAEEIARLAKEIASWIGDEIDQEDAEWAGLLCKADLATELVKEFPQLQGIIGGYYAAEDGFGPKVSEAIRSHYHPKGPSDKVPIGPVACAVALADKIYTLVEFFQSGETPTGSGDPYALRRAALGVSRIILENELRLKLRAVILNDEVFEFIIDRLMIKLKSEGQRHDVLAAVFATKYTEDLFKVMKIVEVLSTFLQTQFGRSFISFYRRISNILRIEEAQGGEIIGPPQEQLFRQSEEVALFQAFGSFRTDVTDSIRAERYEDAVGDFRAIEMVLNLFFDKVTVNDPDPEIRLNRLRLLAQLRDTMHQIADFSKIEG